MKKIVILAALVTMPLLAHATEIPANLNLGNVGSCTPKQQRALCDITADAVSLKPEIQSIITKAVYKGLTEFFNPPPPFWEAPRKHVDVAPTTSLPHRQASYGYNPRGLTGLVEMAIRRSELFKSAGADCLGRPTEEFGFHLQDTLVPDLHSTSRGLNNIVELSYETEWTTKDENGTASYDVYAKDAEELNINILRNLAHACFARVTKK